MKTSIKWRDTRLGGILRGVLTALIAFALILGLMLSGIAPDQYDIQVGRPANKTIYATRDVEDTVTTQQKRDAAAAAVEPSYKSVDTSVNAVVLEELERQTKLLLELVESFAEEAQDGISAELLVRFNESAPSKLTQNALLALLSTPEETLTELAADCSAELSDTLNSTLPEGQERAAVTRISRKLLNQNYPITVVNVFADLLRSCVQPNMLIDTDITEENRRRAQDAVEPEMLVKREVIVREGEIVTEAQYRMIESLGLLADDGLDFALIGGLALMVMVLCIIMSLYLMQFDQSILHDMKRLLLLLIILLTEVGFSLPIRKINASLMPVGLCAILISNLFSGKRVLFLNTVLAFIVAMLLSADGLFSMDMFRILMMAFAAGPIASVLLQQRRLRSGALLTGIAISVCNFAITISIALVSGSGIHTALIDSLWAAAGGVLSALLAIGMQALLEWLFNLATGTRLIELSNPNQPLLRRLLMEAPGTYHHSIIVANLAEAAATAVGANGLLARVGAYYHDVGKLKRPMYFKENQLGDNPHDRTDPRVSVAILTAHPRDGAQMAARERIPAPVVDIIRQHHGDSLALYFYDKASKLYGEDIDAASFRYSGPRPHGKESAVVMLADTIEAATRSLENPTPERMEQLIRKLVRGKLDDGQLNESKLTFNDIDLICASFVTVLTGVFHERIEYPEVAVPPRTADNRLQESAKEAEQAKKTEDDTAPNEQSTEEKTND